MLNPRLSRRSACVSLPGGVWALLACLLIAVSPLVTADDWELLYEGDDLRVLRRDYAGSELDEIQGVVRVQASLSALMALLKDAPFNRHWVYRSGGAQILQESGYATAHVYGVVDAPLPLSDRDSVVRFDYQQDPATRDITITITNVPDYVPPEPNLVRVPDIGGHWFLKPRGDGWVEVTYQVHGDPGGWIPSVDMMLMLEYSSGRVRCFSRSRSPEPLAPPMLHEFGQI